MKLGLLAIIRSFKLNLVSKCSSKICFLFQAATQSKMMRKMVNGRYEVKDARASR